MAVSGNKASVHLAVGVGKGRTELIDGKICVIVIVDRSSVEEPEIDAAYEDLIFKGKRLEPVHSFLP